MAQAVGALGFPGVAFCPADAAPVRELFAGAGMEVVPWHPREGGDRGRVAHAWRRFRLARELRRRRIGVVHCADVAAVRREVVEAARLARVPVVCHIRNRNTALPPWITAHLGEVARFVFMSRATWRHFAYPVPPERGTVIYDGVAVPAGDRERSGEGRAALRAEVRRELGLPADAWLAGMIARVEPQKDFATLARAAARVKSEESKVRWVVIGGRDRTPSQREHFPQVRRWLSESAVEAEVVFAGFRNDVPRLLAALDASVLPTHYEGLPLVIWEAMASGLPVVATAVDGIPEAISDGETGLLVAHADDAGLAEAVLRLCRDPGFAERLGQAGRDWVRTAFDSDRFARETAAVYRVVLGGGDPA